MKFGVYSMRDQLTGFIQPTFEVSDQVALRNFSYAINKQDTLLYASAKHFDLYRIGTFDTDTGEIVKEEPSIVATGLSVLESENGKTKK